MPKGWFDFLGDETSVVEAAEVQVTGSGDMALLTTFLTYRAVDAAGKGLFTKP